MDLSNYDRRYRRILLQDTFEGQEDQVELATLRNTWAQDFASPTKSNHLEVNDKAGLIHHARSLLSHSALPSKPSFLTGKKKELQGWRSGVSRSAWLAASVLTVNAIATIAAVVKFGSNDGIGTAYEGSCSRANSITTALHIVINGLSSILLSASNYTMQALAAPTRPEVDHAHSKRDWMDIGVPSIRNLFKIKWHRRVLWAVLGLSSIPIHLLYNSAVFKSIDANEYMAIIANQAWLQGGNFSISVPWVGSNDWDVLSMDQVDSIDHVVAIQDFFRQSFDNTALVQNLTSSECISTYGSNFVSGNNHVVAITNEIGTSRNQTLFFAQWVNISLTGGETPGYYWMCMSDWNAWGKLISERTTCDPDTLKTVDWIINGRKVEYCLSQNMPQHCTVQFSVYILIAVICMNAMKSISMFFAVYTHRNITLVTIGDTIASYLDRPDELAAGRCLMDSKDVLSWALSNSEDTSHTISPPKAYAPKARKRWFAAASKKRWTICLGFTTLAVIASGRLLAMGSSTIRGYSGSPWSLGWGAINSKAMIRGGLPQSGTEGLVLSVLLANLPQVILSLLYVLYNGLMTSLLLAKEWSDYASQRKTLRVTTPQGAQRSTYYLQLPLRYSIPLLVIMATLHWVVSQSIFLARIDVYNDGVPDDSIGGFSAVGYSIPPILVAILIGILLLVLLIGMGFRELDHSMPVVGSCSIAIAAACHRPEDDVDAAFLPVQWGEVESGLVNDTAHCCFTAQPVASLVPGRMYA